MESIKDKEHCHFCKDTGIAECFNFIKLFNDKNDALSQDEIKRKYTEFTECPEGCRPMN